MDTTAFGVTIGIMMFFVFSIMIIFLIIYLNRKALEHKKVLKEVQEAKQRELLDATFKTLENERTRIGEDMHDDVGPMISTLKMYLTKFRSTASKEEIDDQIIKTNERVDGIMQRIRAVSHAMKPVVLQEFGLIPAIEKLVEDVNEGQHLDVSFKIIGREVELNADSELSVYRIVQELLNNILKHAAAQQIVISLAYDEPGYITLKIMDDGKGLPLSPSKAKGIGLTNIEARASTLRGAFEIKNGVYSGTVATVRFPTQFTKIDFAKT